MIGFTMHCMIIKMRLKSFIPDMNKVQVTWHWDIIWQQVKDPFTILFRGPGFLNSCGALSTIWGTKTLRLCVWLDRFLRKFKEKDMVFLHEIPDQMGILKSLTKWAQKN